jgi:hypothetical protein
MPDYLFDTTLLSNFAAAGRLELLEARYRDVAFTTVEVVDELRRGVKAGYVHLESVLQQVESISPVGWGAEAPLFVCPWANPDFGYTSALSIPRAS